MAGVEDLLSEGLNEGYAGTTERQTAQRGPFQVEVSHFNSPDGGVYHDEWYADELGGGQEIAWMGDEKSTRLYGGGVPPKETQILENLGLTKKDVTSKLKQFIRDSEGKTRLFKDYTPNADGDWQYNYRIKESFDDQGIPLKMGVETIHYKGTLVFVHGFIHSPIK